MLKTKVEQWPFRDHLIIFDTETTGPSIETDRIVEIGALMYCAGNGLLCGRFNQRVKPEVPISAGATSVHGITNEMVKSSPPIGEVLMKFFEWTTHGNPDERCIFTAYNLGFDNELINRELNRLDLYPPTDPPVYKFDTKKLVHRLIQPNEVTDFKLTTLAKHFGIGVSKAHSALGDVEMTYELLGKLLSLWNGRYGSDNVDFNDWIQEDMFLDVWPFGKYKGTPSSELPEAYLHWCTTQMVDDFLFTAKYVLLNVYNQE